MTIVPANQNAFNTQGCTLTGSEVSFQALDSFPAIFRDDSEITFDRSSFIQSVGGYILMMGSRISMSITNSSFDNDFVELDPRDQVGSTSRVVFAFNTVVRTGTLAFERENPNLTGNTGTLLTFIENNIFVTGSGADAVNCPGCSLSNNILSRQMTPLSASNRILDPKLVDSAGHDFHLQPDSPAVDSAMPSVGISTDHDFDGTKRPQGQQLDIGAFERLAN